MRSRNVDTAIDDRRQAGSVFSVVLILLVVVAVAAPGGVADASLAEGAQSSEVSGLDADVFIPGTSGESAEVLLSSWTVEGAEDAVVTLSAVPQSPATLSLSSSSGHEGNQLTFVLRVSGYFDGVISGAVFSAGKGDGFADGGSFPTATPDVDYSYFRKSFHFYDPGEEYLYVNTIEDDVVEPDEWFLMIVTSTYLMGDVRTRGYILNDDCESDVTSYLSLGSTTVAEGDDGTTIADFTVSLDPASTCPVRIRTGTCGVGCSDAATATPGEDYKSTTSDLTFSPGTTSETFSVAIYGDTTFEPDEIFLIGYVTGSVIGAEPPEWAGIGTIVDDDDTFVDDDDSMFEADIEWLVAEGITQGCASDPARYCPDAVVRRSEMATFMVRAMDEVGNVPAYQGYFADVAEHEWYTPFVERAYELGLTAGCDVAPLRYCPDGTVLRSEMAAFLVRQIEGDTNLPTYQAYFADVPSGLWFTPWTERLYELGITSGCAAEPARYCPTEPVIRGEMAAFLHRTFG